MPGEIDKAKALIKFGAQALWGMRLEEAEKTLREAAQAAAAANDLRLRARALTRLLTTLAFLGRSQDAHPLIMDAFKIALAQTGDPIPEIVLESCALRFMPPDNEKVPKLAQELAAKVAQHVQDADVARAAGNVAIVCNLIGNQKLALQLLERAQPVLEAAGYAPEAGTMLGNIADLVVTLEGDNSAPKAVPLLRRAMALHDKSLAPNHPERVGVLLTGGALSARGGRYKDARVLYEKALGIARELGDQGTMQMVHSALGALDVRLLDAPAESHLQKLVEAGAAKGPLEHATALTALCRHYFARGKARAAEPHYRKLREIGAALGETEQMLLQAEMGVPGKIYVLMNQEQAGLAEKLLLGEIETMERVLPKDHAEICQRRYFTGNFYRMNGNHKAALAMFERYTTAERALGENEPGRADGLMRLLDAQLELGRKKDAERSAEEIERLTGRKPRLDAALNEFERQLRSVWMQVGLKREPDLIGAALARDANASFVVALCFAAGQGVPRDYKRAAVWLDQAAAAGHAEAGGLAAALRRGEQPEVDFGFIAQCAAEWAERNAKN